MRKLTVAIAIILIIMSAILIIAKPVIGILGVAFGIFLIVWKPKQPVKSEPTEPVKSVAAVAKMKLQVAGRAFHDVDKVVDEDGYYNDSCRLVEEPGNEHDPNAIKVMVKGHLIGYVPKDLTAEVRKYSWDDVDVYIDDEEAEVTIW